MSYTKQTNTPNQAATDAINAALAFAKVDASEAASLVAAASTVQLDSGQTVLCSCSPADRPDTPEFDLLTVAVELVDGAYRQRANGNPVCVAWWTSVAPDSLASITMDTARKACLMIALGEPQPQILVPNPDENGPTEQDVFQLTHHEALCRSIRTVIAAADQAASALADVL